MQQDAPVSYSISLVTGPTVEPVTLTEAKVHCRIGHDADDALFAIWIEAARQLIETETSCRLIDQTWRLQYTDFPRGQLPGIAGQWQTSGPRLNQWPADGWIEIPVQPVSAVTLFKYLDTAGTLQTLTEGTDFLTAFGRAPAAVYRHPDRYSWPQTATGRLDAVTLEFTAGYGAAASDVPALAKNAILLTVGYWDANRGDAENPMGLGLPPGARRLLDRLDNREYR